MMKLSRGVCGIDLAHAAYHPCPKRPSHTRSHRAGRDFAGEIAPQALYVLRRRSIANHSFIIHRPGDVETKQLPLTTIDKLVAELKLERVDFIKMDIEGAEQRALQGGRGTLEKHQSAMALSAYHVPSDPERLPALVRAAWAGYRMDCGPCAEANGHVRPDVLYFH